MMAQNREIFFCYAHEDEALCLSLERQLQALQRQQLITIWHDRNISAGTEWKQAINRHLNTAQIILLLISPDFMASDYCYSIEMQRAMERHKRGEACVIPVILRPTLWHNAPFGALQALPANAVPVTDRSWHTQDEAFLNIAEGIVEVIEEFSPFSPGYQGGPQKRRKSSQSKSSPGVSSNQQHSSSSTPRVPPNQPSSASSPFSVKYDQRHQQVGQQYNADSITVNQHLDKQFTLWDLENMKKEVEKTERVGKYVLYAIAIIICAAIYSIYHISMNGAEIMLIVLLLGSITYGIHKKRERDTVQKYSQGKFSTLEELEKEIEKRKKGE